MRPKLGRPISLISSGLADYINRAFSDTSSINLNFAKTTAYDSSLNTIRLNYVSTTINSDRFPSQTYFRDII
jgi:hypothetical protein